MSDLASTSADLESLRAALEGQVVGPDDADYEEARRIWNGMIDRHPAAVARCASVSDVVGAVNFARRLGLPLAVRCGGHSTPGYSTCDAGLVLDLRLMNRISIDPQARTARTQGGALWGEFDAATQQHGLAVTGGRVSTTGVAGLALGSGSGWLERVYGVTCDSLISAEVVTASGEVVTASANENSDLLWGLRGGGGNFGVVTEFEFRLHPVGPIVAGGLLAYPRAQATEVIRAYRDYMADAPDQVGGGVALLTAPPEPFVPAAAQGQPAVAIVYCYAGEVDRGMALAEGLRSIGTPVVDLIQPMPYVAIQSMLDGGMPRGIREYFKVDYLTALSDQAIDVIVEQGESLPAPFGQLILGPMGGALDRRDSSSMALELPHQPWLFFCLSLWMDPAEDDQNTAWARGYAEAMRPFGVDQAPPNFIAGDEPPSRMRASFGEEKYGKLVELKRRWDPDNLFRLNQNIAV